MSRYKTHYRVKLPHIQPMGEVFFVTYCLKEAMTQPEIIKLQIDFEIEKQDLKGQPNLLDIAQRRYFGKFDEALHSFKHINHLSDNRLAQEVVKSLHFWDGKRVELIAFCIMSNHVHVVVRMFSEKESDVSWTLTSWLQSVKQFSSKACNKLLGNGGSKFWQKESYDRLVRDREELYRIISYTLDNPIKAGLCKNRSDWKWNYIKEKYNEYI
jgi:putative transposase